jgi:hypothetical protein
MEGGTTFHFVTGGIEEALVLAKKAAGSKDAVSSTRQVDEKRPPTLDHELFTGTSACRNE